MVMPGSRAVSELVGYIYIFGIVMLVLGIAYVNVTNEINKAKNAIFGESIEYTFRRIQYIFYSVAFNEAPSQIMEMNMLGGSLKLVEDEPRIILGLANTTVKSLSVLPGGAYCDEPYRLFRKTCLNLSTGDIENPAGGVCNRLMSYPACVLEVDPGSFQYTYREKKIALEAGGVFTKYITQESSQILSNPKIITNRTSLTAASRYILVTIPVLNGSVEVSGSGSVRISAVENETDTRYSVLYIGEKGFKTPLNWSVLDEIDIFIKNTEFTEGWCKLFEKSELLRGVFKTNFTGGLYCLHQPACDCIHNPSLYAHVYMPERSGPKTTVIVLVKRVDVSQVT